jgi:hypothetical protein
MALGLLQRAILDTLRAGSHYPNPSPLGMTFGELCQRTRPKRWERKWSTHKNAVSRCIWNLAEREVPLVRVWALLLVPVHVAVHRVDSTTVPCERLCLGLWL